MVTRVGAALAAFLVAASAAVQEPALFSCTSGPATVVVFNNASLSYSVFMGDELWAYGGKLVARSEGVDLDIEDGSLQRTAVSSGNGTDALGPYTELTMGWGAPSQPAFQLTTTIRCYSTSWYVDAPPVVFETVWPSGATGTSMDTAPDAIGGVTRDGAANAPTARARGLRRRGGRRGSPRAAASASGGEFNATNLPLAQFPTFIAMPYNALGGTLGFLEWAGRFTNDQVSHGTGLRGFTGGQMGGPLVLFDPAFTPGNASAGAAGTAKPRSLLVGPWAGMKTTILGIVEDHLHRGVLWRLAAGPQGHITSLPPGFSVAFALVPSTSGITDVTYAYGSAMRRLYGTQRMAGLPASAASAEADPLQYKLSYWSDNGAMYDNT